jgi:DNA-binding transcriptional ArsR family regulator
LAIPAPKDDDRVARDAKALRALAHPLRLRLLAVAAAEGGITTTRASECTGESSANCSFHLRLLARYGFLVPVESRDRRERPWRLADTQPLTHIWQQLSEGDWQSKRPEESDLFRLQLRIFDPAPFAIAA